MNPVFLLLPLVAGVAAAMQTAINGRLAAALDGDNITAALFSFLVGALALAGVALGRGSLPAAVARLPAQPAWHLAGGLLSATSVLATILLSPRIGSVNTLALVLMGQLAAALLIDQYGFAGVAVRHVSAARLAGGVVVLGGALLMLFGDRLAALAAR
ncbi:DMT family transporter [Cupriavidus sp. 30B13]|uniref:DMT family transporter n=1 Tax=Cupriavidus sp. 30B13 TaxID=3384241 RepID=UPI003B90C538